jgi:thymidine kinase
MKKGKVKLVLGDSKSGKTSYLIKNYKKKNSLFIYPKSKLNKIYNENILSLPNLVYLNELPPIHIFLQEYKNIKYIFVDECQEINLSLLPLYKLLGINFFLAGLLYEFYLKDTRIDLYTNRLISYVDYVDNLKLLNPRIGKDKYLFKIIEYTKENIELLKNSCIRDLSFLENGLCWLYSDYSVIDVPDNIIKIKLNDVPNNKRLLNEIFVNTTRIIGDSTGIKDLNNLELLKEKLISITLLDQKD